MSSPIAEFPELMRALPGAAREVIESSWPTACKALSTESQRGLLEMVVRLVNEGAGMAPIVSLLRSVPQVAREAQSWALPAFSVLSNAIVQRAGPTALEAFFDTLPGVRHRLEGNELLQEYFVLVEELSELAPAGLAPLFTRAASLLDQLSLHGLRRWALLGVQNYAADADAQVAWFGLDDHESRAILRAAADGVLLADVERRLEFYLRALWARELQIRASMRARSERAAIVDGSIRLPPAVDAFPREDSTGVYRASVAHAAAHLAYSRSKFPLQSLRPIQVALVSLIEDARVERLAIRDMPGLQRVWQPYHVAMPTFAVSAVSLMARLARALLDEDYVDDNPFVLKGRRMFARGQERLHDAILSREIGNLLGNDLGQMRVQFNFKTYVVEPLYRDDNMHLWDLGDQAQPQSDEQETIYQAVRLQQEEGSEHSDAEIEQEEGRDAEPDRGQLEIGANEEVGIDERVRSYHYDEWDYLIALDRPGWCTLWEKPAPHGDAALIDEVLRRNDATVRRLTSLIKAVQMQRPQRLRRQLEGDRLDVDACVRATIDIRSGRPPDPRVHQRLGRNLRDLAVLVLLDLSQSTNDWVPTAATSVLNLAREASALLAHAMQDLGDDFAIHGFDSNGRHEVEYYRFKDFDSPYDAAVKARLAGMRGQLSTRMGAALRHAGHVLSAQRAAHRMILLLTDGEPHDIDVHDKQYLLFDTKRAVEEQRYAGIVTFCLSLDARADEYVSRIFGARNYMVLDQLGRLPEKLPALYLRLTA